MTRARTRVAGWVRDWRDRIEHSKRWRASSRAGSDPIPALAGGRYYLSIGTRGWRYEHEYEVSRADLEFLAEALNGLLTTTRPNGRGGWQWFDPNPDTEPAPGTYWERAVLERFVTGGPVDLAAVREQVAALLAATPRRDTTDHSEETPCP